MLPEDIKIEEYKSLRNSIDMHMKLIPEIFAIMVAATSALLGYGFKSQIFIVFLFPLFIIIPCAFLILSQMNEVMLKGAYIKKQYEQDVWGWESALFKFRQIREKNKKKLFYKAAEDARAFVLIIDFLILICFAGFFWFFDFVFIERSFSSVICPVVSLVVLWVGVFLLAYFLNKGMLEAYTFEKEEKILNDLDDVF